MNHATRPLSLILAAVLVMLSGCMRRPANSSAAPPPPISSSAVVHANAPEKVRLPWFGNDTLNQYNCATLQNYYLAGLLCDPLVALDDKSQPVNRLALEVASADHLQYTITLRSDAAFSDGSLLTSADVLYSLGLAQASPRFAAGLDEVVSAVAPNDSSISVTLSVPDIFFPRSLVFPILKNDTGELPIPVGVGRFVAKVDENRFLRNDNYYKPVSNISEVQLLDTDSLEEQSYGIMEDTIDLMYSDLQTDLNLGLGIGYRQIPLSNLVYIGVNHSRSWADKTMRQALSGLVRREEVARRVYIGFASVTSIPVNPITAATSLSVTDLDVNLDKQRALLESDGWLLQKDGSRQKNGVTLALELLVNTDNNERLACADLVADMYRLAGIRVTVTALPFEQYKARIAAGEYDLCIAETRIPYNINISRLILPTVGTELPVPVFPSLNALYSNVRAGKSETVELENMLREELPVIPLLFRRGILCFSRDFSANIVATEQDIFYNIGEW